MIELEVVMSWWLSVIKSLNAYRIAMKMKYTEISVKLTVNSDTKCIKFLEPSFKKYVALLFLFISRCSLKVHALPWYHFEIS